MDETWVRLGRRIQIERALRGYANATELATAAGLSRRTVEIIESASHSGHPRPTTLAKIERALGWADGSTDLIREGRQPWVVNDPALARLLSAWPELTPEQKRAVAHLAETFLRS